MGDGKTAGGGCNLTNSVERTRTIWGWQAQILIASSFVQDRGRLGMYCTIHRRCKGGGFYFSFF